MRRTIALAVALAAFVGTGVYFGVTRLSAPPGSPSARQAVALKVAHRYAMANTSSTLDALGWPVTVDRVVMASARHQEAVRLYASGPG